MSEKYGVSKIGVALDDDLPDHTTGIRCPACGSTDVAILKIGHVANCTKCGTSFPFRKASIEDAEKLKKGRRR